MLKRNVLAVSALLVVASGCRLETKSSGSKQESPTDGPTSDSKSTTDSKTTSSTTTSTTGSDTTTGQAEAKAEVNAKAELFGFWDLALPDPQTNGVQLPPGMTLPKMPALNLSVKIEDPGTFSFVYKCGDKQLTGRTGAEITNTSIKTLSDVSLKYVAPGLECNFHFDQNLYKYSVSGNSGQLLDVHGSVKYTMTRKN